MTSPIGLSPQPIQKKYSQHPAFGRTPQNQRTQFSGSPTPRFGASIELIEDEPETPKPGRLSQFWQSTVNQFNNLRPSFGFLQSAPAPEKEIELKIPGSFPEVKPGAANATPNTQSRNSRHVTVEEVQDIDAPKPSATKSTNTQGQPLEPKMPGAFPEIEPENVPLPKQTEAEVAELANSQGQPKTPENIPLPKQTEAEIAELINLQEPKTPENDGESVDNNGSSATVETVAESGPVQDAGNDQQSQTTQNNDSDNNKADDKKDSILHGWKKTKAITGAALLAGGIALKMTLIGIVPGLIMAGAGAALMGWAVTNWAMSDKKDDTKAEDGKDNKAADNK